MKLMLCSVYNVHYTLKPTSTYSGTLDTLKHQLNQVLRLYLGGAVGSVVYKIKDEFRYRVLPVENPWPVSRSAERPGFYFQARPEPWSGARHDRLSCTAPRLGYFDA